MASLMMFVMAYKVILSNKMNHIILSGFFDEKRLYFTRYYSHLIEKLLSLIILGSRSYRQSSAIKKQSILLYNIFSNKSRKMHVLSWLAAQYVKQNTSVNSLLLTHSECLWQKRRKLDRMCQPYVSIDKRESLISVTWPFFILRTL